MNKEFQSILCYEGRDVVGGTVSKEGVYNFIVLSHEQSAIYKLVIKKRNENYTEVNDNMIIVASVC